MVLTWYGGSCVSVEERVRGEAPRSVLFFPHTKTSRARTLEEKANIIVTDSRNATKDGSAFLVRGAGEYDVAGFFLRGTEFRGGVFAYAVEVGDLRLCAFLSGLPKELRDSDIEAIGETDALLLGMMDQAASVSGLNDALRAIEPHVFIALTQNPKLRSLIKKEVGSDGETMSKAALAKKDMPEEGIRLLFLDPQ